MYPYELFFGLTLYDIAILVGVLAAFFLADHMTVRLGFSVGLQRAVILCALSAVIVGYGSAVLFQALYDIPQRGFVIDRYTGATFYGGLIGGAACFLLMYFFIAPLFCKDRKEPLKRFGGMADIAACCIPLAHAFGRLGCFFAGCCHGRETDAWYGVNMFDYSTAQGEVWHRVVPVQLFESLFLFLLAGVLLFLFFRKKGEKKAETFPLLPVYCIAYGIWRFAVEFFRADDRGQTIVPFLTPSQLVALLLIAVGGVYFFLWIRKLRKKNSSSGTGEA